MKAALFAGIAGSIVSTAHAVVTTVLDPATATTVNTVFQSVGVTSEDAPVAGSSGLATTVDSVSRSVGVTSGDAPIAASSGSTSAILVGSVTTAAASSSITSSAQLAVSQVAPITQTIAAQPVAAQSDDAQSDDAQSVATPSTSATHQSHKVIKVIQEDIYDQSSIVTSGTDQQDQQSSAEPSSSPLSTVSSSTTQATTIVLTKPAPRPYRLGHFAGFNYAIATQKSASAVPSSPPKLSTPAKASSVARPSSPAASASASVKPSSPARASSFTSLPRPASYASRSTPTRSAVSASATITPSRPSLPSTIPNAGVSYISVPVPTTVYSGYTTTTSETLYVTKTFYDIITQTITDQDEPRISLITETHCSTFTHPAAPYKRNPRKVRKH